MSKAVLGQTATTDAITGGLGSGEEHADVRKDIETADARALAAILNRDLIQPWVWLNHGPQTRYPRLVIARPEREDLTAFATAIGPLIDRGLPVSQQSVLAKFGLPEPKKGEALLRPEGAADPAAPPPGADRAIKRNPGDFKRVERSPGIHAALQTEGAPAAVSESASADEVLADRMAQDARPAMAMIMDQIEVMVSAAGSLQELREMLLTGFPQIDSSSLAQILGLGLVAAHAGGRVAIEEEAE